MKFKIFVLLCLFSLQKIVAQPTAKDFYPQLKDINLGNGDRYNLKNFLNFNGCVFGDCLEGEGIWITVQILKDGSVMNGKSSLGYNYYKYANTQIWVMKGVFSNNGMSLRGSAYSILVNYEIKDGSKTIKPTSKIDYSPANLKSYINFEGEIIGRKESSNTFYSWKEGISHWMAKNRNDIKKYYGYFNHGAGEFVEIDYIKGKRDSVDRFVGIINNDETYLMGQTYFNDKLLYEGFFLNGKYHGPGKFYKIGNEKPVQGMWNKGKLIIDMPIQFPDGTFTNKANVSRPFNLEFAKQLHAGRAIGDDKNGEVIFISDNRKYFYFGKMLGQKVNGMGYSYLADLKPQHNVACCKVSYDGHFLGKFKNGEFADGTIIENTYYTELNGLSSARLNFVMERNGTFANGMLNGCGSTKTWDGQHETYTQGSFVNNEIQGWHYYKATDKRFLHDNLNHRKLYAGLTDNVYNELKNSISANCIDATVADVSAFLDQKKKAYDTKLQNDAMAAALAKQKAEIADANCKEAIKRIGAIYSKNGVRYYVVGVDCKYDSYMVLVGDQTPISQSTISGTTLLSYTSEMGRHNRKLCTTCNGRGAYKQMNTTDSWGYRGGYDVNIRVRTLTHKMENTLCVTCSGKGFY